MRFAAVRADDLGEAGPRAQRIGELLRLDIGSAATLGPHDAALGKRGQRAPHCVAVHAIGFSDLHLARQLVAGHKAAVGDAALDAVGNEAPQRDARGGCVLNAHVAGKLLQKSRLCHETVMALPYQVV
ncbi:hypothetical protein ACVWW4_005879 [Bradyrhizobium sp. LB7.1]